jgi:hypothetical protein
MFLTIFVLPVPQVHWLYELRIPQYPAEAAEHEAETIDEEYPALVIDERQEPPHTS